MGKSNTTSGDDKANDGSCDGSVYALYTIAALYSGTLPTIETEVSVDVLKICHVFVNLSNFVNCIRSMKRFVI